MASTPVTPGDISISPETSRQNIIDILATGLANLAADTDRKHSLNPAKKPLSFLENPGSVCPTVKGI